MFYTTKQIAKFERYIDIKMHFKNQISDAHYLISLRAFIYAASRGAFLARGVLLYFLKIIKHEFSITN